MGKDNSDKEGWIGALGKAMIKTSVMMDNMDGVYMWEIRKFKEENDAFMLEKNLQINKHIIFVLIKW